MKMLAAPHAAVMALSSDTALLGTVMSSAAVKGLGPCPVPFRRGYGALQPRTSDSEIRVKDVMSSPELEPAPHDGFTPLPAAGSNFIPLVRHLSCSFP